MALRLPKIFNLRSDPFETADHERMDVERWRVERLFLLVPAQQYVGRFLATFKEFPPSQKPGSFSIDRALQTLQQGPARPIAPPVGNLTAGRSVSVCARYRRVVALHERWWLSFTTASSIHHAG
ncbi:MAG TPA: hypothetical protein VIQ27_04650 [Gemmatimonadales bacterium]